MNFTHAKKKIAFALIVLAALVVAGCGGDKNPSGHTEYDITLNDGRELHCVQIGSGNAVSHTCDWESAS